MARVLIVGAGIAGDALAVSLERTGWQVVVAEIAPALRTGGQTVDLRGSSAAVLAHLGLLDACREHLVAQRGIAWIDARGRRLADLGVEAFGGHGFVSTEELLRSDLARVLHEATGTNTTHWFQETVEALEPVSGGVRAHFRHHEAQVFDLVVGADGTHSRVRCLVMGPEERFRRTLGLAHAWFTLTETATTERLDGWFLVHNAPGGRVLGVRPGHPGQQEAGLSFRTTGAGGSLPGRHDREAQHALLAQEFNETGWRTAELLEAARHAPDFAMDTFDQIHASSWQRGRVVLLGDSAWCASPLSGLGTALALEGAHTLAGVLTGAGVHRDPDEHAVTAALARFEQEMRPAVTAAQKLPPGRVALYAPRTRPGIRAAAAAMRAVTSPLLTPVLKQFATRHGEGRALRRYDTALSGAPERT